MEIKKYITENEPKMLEDLFSLIRIPSISAKPEHHDDMLACAERWAQLLLEAGADEALVMPSKGNPIVFGQKIVDPDANLSNFGKATPLNRKYATNISGHVVLMMTKGNLSYK